MFSSAAINRPLAWLRRYLPAELVCMPTGLLCAWAAVTLTGSTAASVVAYTWAEALAYYSMMLARELAHRGVWALPAVLYDLFREFGPAAALDGLLIRPTLIYAGVTLAPSFTIGIVAGKYAADLVFYVPVILSYELLRRARPEIVQQPS